MKQRPFSVSLDLPQFTAGLQKGQGRVLMHARAVGLAGFEAAVIDACLHDRAYDPQCEGDRSSWLMTLVAASGSQARIVDELMPQLDAPSDRYWDAVQRCRIAYYLAQHGYSDARSRVYAGLRKWPDSADVIGAEEIVALDGADGLLFVAQHLGTLLQQEPGFWVDDGLIGSFDDTHGMGSGRRILDAASQHSPSVEVYLRHLDERNREKWNSNDTIEQKVGYLDIANVKFDLTKVRLDASAGRESYVARMQRISAAEVICKIEAENPQQNRGWFMGWGRHATAGDLATVFEAMTRQSEPGRLCKYLRVFYRGVLPSFDARMLCYAEHTDAEVRQAAHRALSNYAHPEVRRLAIERLTAGRFLEDELGLLKLNYKSGDAELIEKLLPVSLDRESLHGLVYDLVELFGANQGPESATLMTFVYEESPCSSCRAKAVEILANTGKLLDWLREECADDCSEKIRAIASSVT